MTARLLALTLALSVAAQAQGTKLWTVDRYDSMERGTADGVAIRNDGRLEPGPATSLVFDTTRSYVWSLAADQTGNAYLGLGGSTAGSAQLLRVTPDGKSNKVFESKELAVQSVALAADGTVFAATSPDGKVYRIPTSGSPTTIFDPATTAEKPKYLWDLALSPSGDLYIAAGAPAAVYKIPSAVKAPAANAQPKPAEVLFKTSDQHIRCLLLTPANTLWAGSDGSGVIYRIDTADAHPKPFAVYAAPRREITSLALDSSGAVYAAGVGGKGAAPLPPLPVTGNVGVSITFVQPGSSTAANNNALVPEGSEIYRIAPDGTPSRLAQLKDDVVYSLAVRNDQLIAATGNRGRVYRVDTTLPNRFADLAHLDAAQGMALAPTHDGLFAATSNSGKLFRLADLPAKDPTYTSEVFDAGSLTQWGRTETRADGSAYELFVRTGNVESPLTGWSDWTRVATDGSATVPPGRYAQWKAVLRAPAPVAEKKPASQKSSSATPPVSIDSVALNYLTRNLAPVVDEIVVQPGARMPQTGSSQQSNTTVQVAFPQPAGSSAVSFEPNAATTPLTAQKDKTAVTVRWLAHDDNGDELTFSVWYRGSGEANWRLLKDRITDRYLSFDSALLPDGIYTLKVIASDAPSHTGADALTGERESSTFTIDTTPPVPGPLTATITTLEAQSGPNKSSVPLIHATLEVRDTTSPIAHAEYSIDAGPWQYLEPVGKVSDSLTERYDFTVPIPQPTAPVSDSTEHVLAVRVYDRYDNMASVKAIVR